MDPHDTTRLREAKGRARAILARLHRARERGDRAAIERLHGALIAAAWEVGLLASRERLRPWARPSDGRREGD
jgi:hypothetical protein